MLTKIRMSTVNVDVDGCSLFFGPGLILEGEIKRIAQDFRVRELYFEPIDSQNVQSSCKANNNDGYVDHGDGVTILHGMDYLIKVISPEVIRMIDEVSRRHSEMLLAARESKKAIKLNDRRRVAVQLPMKMSKKERGIFHVAVKDAFSYILTAAMSIEECIQEFTLCAGADEKKNLLKEGNGLLDGKNEAASEHMDVISAGSSEEEPYSDDANRNEGITQEMAGIWVSADTSLIELAVTAMTMEDINTLYAFKINGPHHKDARSGIKVCLGLSREERTNVYRIITSNCLSLDSKTAEDRNNKQNKRCKKNKDKGDAGTETDNNSKSMIIFWRKKASFSKGRKIDEVDADGAVESELHVGFTLCKINTEHLGALQRIAQVAGVAVSDVTFHGIKDKKAVTFQRCVITLRCQAASVLECDDVIEQHDECLKNVLDRNMRNHASGVINSLSLSFPYPPMESTTLQVTASSHIDDNPSLSVYGFFITSRPLRIGGLWGNSFKIRIRNIAKYGSPSKPSREIVSALKCRFENIVNTGFPNFFGSQRMGYQDPQTLDSTINTSGNPYIKNQIRYEGEIIPLGPIIGKLLLLGKYQKALNAIILGTVEYVRPLDGVIMTALQKARFMYFKGIEPGVVLSLFPSTAVKERILLKALVRFGHNKVENSKIIIEEIVPLNHEDAVSGMGVKEVVDISSNIDLEHNNSENYDVKNNNNNINNNNNNKSCEKIDKCKAEESASKILSQLPYSTRSLWVSSYQSWLWNRVAAHRLYPHTEHDLTDMQLQQEKELDLKREIVIESEGDEVVENDDVNDTPPGVYDNDVKYHQINKYGNGKKDFTEAKKKETSVYQSYSIQTVDDESLLAMVGDLVHVQSLAPYLLKSSDYSNINSHDNVRNSNSNDNSSNNNKKSDINCNEESNSVIALTEEHIAAMTLDNRRHVFKHYVVLPLFGKKVLYPNNANGRYVHVHAHVRAYSHTHKQTSTHTHTHTHSHIHTHTHMHIRIHITSLSRFYLINPAPIHESSHLTNTEHRYYSELLRAEGILDCFDPLKPLGYMRSSDTAGTEKIFENFYEINSRSIVPVPRGAYRKIMVRKT